VQRTDWGPLAAGITWTPDGRDLIFSSADVSGARTYRLAAFGKQAAAVVPELPIGGNQPSASKAMADGTFRLAFVHGLADVGLRMIDLLAPESKDESAAITRFSDSARRETPGRFSRDGALVAFVSNRSGSPQVWIAERDGSDSRSITTLDATSINVGSWAPDGASVMFDAVVEGNADIYAVSAESGQVRRLTDSPAADTDPEWSADGGWVYYASDVSGRSEVWRMASSGGPSKQITTGGGFEPREASDGRSLYFVDRFRNAEGLGTPVRLKQVSVDGGKERTVFADARAGAWDVTDRGIVFLATSSDMSSRTPDALALFSVADGTVRTLKTLPFRLARFPTPRLTASRDGRWVLVNHLDAWERDIMVAESVR
jgi:dipeptidyl aminopeptidase/acylaminoacyl peptidase